ncbi:hypothetical protein QYE76_058918 [Lolium multiflorum]|uniref:Reverse transcriptase zinc-binding domain-containing protein n=1 Tax=Lolium multiflorum TaxID=4521 RepID=A0AAD8T765_LOLMU|nr:hypothetical protein QYE76_058918 [Lolium multiflorum]
MRSLNHYSFLVESRGELLWALIQVDIYRYPIRPKGEYLKYVVSFRLHVLEEETSTREKKTRWVKKDGRSLADRVLFLGTPNSFAIDASRLRDQEGGCAYFVIYNFNTLKPEKVEVWRCNLVSNKAEFVEQLPRRWDNERCTWHVPQPPSIAPIQRLVVGISLGSGADRRFIDYMRRASFCSREAYRMLSPPHPPDASACVAWSLRLPSKLKIFAYLDGIDRLSTRANLFHKSCAPSETCAVCDAVETSRHLFLECTTASHVWARLGVLVPSEQFSIWELPVPLGVATATWHFGVAAIMWSIWKTRNDLVFNGITTSPVFAIRRACDDIALWRWRIPHLGRADVDSLRSYMLMRCD